MMHGASVVQLLTVHLEGNWVSDDPSDVGSTSRGSKKVKKRWAEAMSFLWTQLQQCLNKSFLYVNHYAGRLHCTSTGFAVQKVGETDSGLSGEGGFWRIALGGQDEASSSQAAEKLSALLSQLQGDAQK